jgi:hypothetical protein
MTIIAVWGACMCADSEQFRAEIGYPSPDLKITRAPDGSLVGACGASVDTWALREWVRAGMDFSNPPKLGYPAASEDSAMWLWLKADRTVWKGDADMRLHPVCNPGSMGRGASYVDGALGLIERYGIEGISLADVVSLAISRVQYIGGPVQTEYVCSS